jgi:hypothetical protein
MSAQPKWKQVGTIGDINFVQHDGGPVFIDETGVYCPELEYVQNMPREDGNEDAYVYRITLDALTISPAGHLIPARYDATWPHPIEDYTEWFDNDIESVCHFVGIGVSDFIQAITSDNPMARASAYEALAQYHGWENFDSYPLHIMTEAELEARYENHPYVGHVR